MRLKKVAPHAGAWIETGTLRDLYVSAGSHPMRVRGLKHSVFSYMLPVSLVAPHAGAWIETFAEKSRKNPVTSHPMRVRGLKPQ